VQHGFYSHAPVGMQDGRCARVIEPLGRRQRRAWRSAPARRRAARPHDYSRLSARAMSGSAADRAVCWSLRLRPPGVARAHPRTFGSSSSGSPAGRRPLQGVAGWPGSNARSAADLHGLLVHPRHIHKAYRSG